MTSDRAVVTRRIEGTIRTASGPLRGALVELFVATGNSLPEPPAKSLERKAACFADRRGNFRVPHLKPGWYEVRVSGQHWETWRIRVRVDPKARTEPIELEVAPPL